VVLFWQSVVVITRMVPVQVGEVEVLVEAVVPSGTEPTSARVDEAVRRVGEAFDRAQDVVVEMGVKAAQSVAALAERSARPDQLAVEFGLSFTASGGVVIAGASAEASLKVTLTYDRSAQPAQAPGGAAQAPGGAVRASGGAG
jgi:hypothetical protein